MSEKTLVELFCLMDDDAKAEMFSTLLEKAYLSGDQETINALMNVDKQAGFPHDITWPTKPE